MLCSSDNGEEVWGRGEEEGHKDHHHPRAGPESDGEGGGPGLLRHQQGYLPPSSDVPTGVHHQARSHAADMTGS